MFLLRDANESSPGGGPAAACAIASPLPAGLLHPQLMKANNEF